MSSDTISNASNDNILSRVQSGQSENRDGFFESYSFPPKNHPIQRNPSNQTKSNQINPFERINSVQPPTKPYRSMSVPGVFPLRRRQSSASPLSKISYSEESKDEPSIIKSQNEASSHLRRASLGGDPNHQISFNYRRRLSNPGSFSLKHDRQPSPLGTKASITNRSHSNSVSSSASSGYFSDISEITSQSSINESEIIHSDVCHPIPNQFRNMTSKSKPSPLGSRRPLSIGNSLLSTIDDELSVTP
ncbi:uncharacterized protein MELLADRAFT_70553 [Melampsora larici-populina 98AG31]|uniref:Uncharacterized protein n=1 Tax=Melampsora larici-populina (strain 98AG31 / pathotype 3-4-7) TaxID=747676 RepID=F4R4U2_MELLP|nr:uncharacterized protein MELLADRAFT_70553 [Melampsora larici-populina 98AG31]EGG12940.1 hypothetical protein MELLADRAFT_70553 [Melampsora larici-populina 98AG31]